MKRSRKITAWILIMVFIFMNLPANVVNVSAAGISTHVLNASDLTDSEYKGNTSIGDGYFQILVSNAAKPVNVDNSEIITVDNRLITKRIKLNGTGTIDQRAIQFTTTGTADITVYAVSGSSSIERTLALYRDGVDTNQTFTAVASAGDKLAAQTVLGVEPGTYTIYSQKDGINIYYISVKEATEGEGDPEESRPMWTESLKASVVSAEKSVDAGDYNILNVNWNGNIENDGADMIVARLYNSEGSCVSTAKTIELGIEGVLKLRVPESGNYIVKLETSRAGVVETFSEEYAVNNFKCDLEKNVNITSVLTGMNSSLIVEWASVKEAETYTVEYKSQSASDFIKAADGLTYTSYKIEGLSAGETYDIKVTAYRGSESTSGLYTKKVETQAERWKSVKIGSGETGTIVDNNDGSLTFTSTSSKLAESEDQFLYYYTEIDPTTENFTLTATFVMDDVSTSDNQTGFGVIAIDSFDESVDNRYFNSAGSLFGRFSRVVDGASVATQGIPGGRFITGYQEGTTSATVSGTRKNIDTEPFDWNYREEDDKIDVTKPRFLQGEEYTLTLRKSNTGFHAIMTIDGEKNEVICYEPDLLLKQDQDKYYVGVFTARKIKATIKDIQFTTVTPENDDPAEARPISYIAPYFKLDSTLTTSNNQYNGAFYANIKGTIAIKNAQGATVVSDVSIKDAQRTLATLSLAEGNNKFTAVLTPVAKEQQDLEAYTDYTSYEPIELPFTISHRKIGTNKNAVYVSPAGTSTGEGTKASPVDIYTAVDYAQPGQEIVLLGGNYNLSKGIIVERGNSGTADKPITLMSDPNQRAVLNMSNSTTGGIIIKADYWHVYDIEICNTERGKPAHIMGNYNIFEKITTHDNKDTGLQISGVSTEPYEMWPSYNQVISCESYNNCDVAKNDADGFAAKIFVGDKNVFRNCISRNNIDDGWDLYAKSTSGSIGAVTIENCVAYNNGHLTYAPDDSGEGNGFKLGGESMPGAHVLKNSISFNNDGKGITSNSGPDCQVIGNISVGNKGGNIYLNTKAAASNWVLQGTLSYNGQAADSLGFVKQEWVNDGTVYVNGTNGSVTVTDDWFESTDMTIVPTIAEDGSIDMHSLLVLTGNAPDNTGARIEANPNPTIIEIGSEIQIVQPTPTPTPTPTPIPDSGSAEDKADTEEPDKTPVAKPDKPVITTNVVNKTQTVNKGGKVTTLKVKATGDNLTYQWYVNTKNSVTGAKKISKATKSSYTPNADAAGTKYYFCKITNTDDTTTEKEISIFSKIVKIVVKVPVKTIKVTAPSSSLKVGKTMKLSVKLTPSSATEKEVVYKSSNTKYATVSKDGTVKALKAGKGKKVTITVTSKDNSKLTKKITITIK